MKEKITLSLEKDFLDWIKNTKQQKNISAFINELLKEKKSCFEMEEQRKWKLHQQWLKSNSENLKEENFLSESCLLDGLEKDDKY